MKNGRRGDLPCVFSFTRKYESSRKITLQPSLPTLGRIAQEVGQFNEAEKWYRRSLEIEEKTNDEYGQATVLYQLGRLAQELRHFGEARAFYRKAEGILQRVSDFQTLAVVRQSLAEVTL